MNITNMTPSAARLPAFPSLGPGRRATTTATVTAHALRPSHPPSHTLNITSPLPTATITPIATSTHRVAEAIAATYSTPPRDVPHTPLAAQGWGVALGLIVLTRMTLASWWRKTARRQRQGETVSPVMEGLMAGITRVVGVGPYVGVVTRDEMAASERTVAELADTRKALQEVVQRVKREKPAEQWRAEIAERDARVLEAEAAVRAAQQETLRVRNELAKMTSALEKETAAFAKAKDDWAKLQKVATEANQTLADEVAEWQVRRHRHQTTRVGRRGFPYIVGTIPSSTLRIFSSTRRSEPYTLIYTTTTTETFHSPSTQLSHSLSLFLYFSHSL